jgi:hypothetical protein
MITTASGRIGAPNILRWSKSPRKCGGFLIDAAKRTAGLFAAKGRSRSEPYPVFGPKKLDPTKIIAQMTANTPIARTGTMIPSSIGPSQ